jgi:glycosyltransferase involved in cell wall biosynthesis
MNLSLCITTFNRFTYLRESFAQVINHPRITEIILMDDCSDLEIFKQVEALKALSPKIKVYRQARNRGMAYNKYSAVGYASNDFCILFDSDNTLTNEYVDKIPETMRDETIYCPDWAMPQFDYRKFAGMTYGKRALSNFINKPMFEQHLNTCNYVVPAERYCQVFQEDATVKETDTVHFAYLWLKAGFKFHVVAGMRYSHLVHAESGWLKNADYNIRKGHETLKLISGL